MGEDFFDELEGLFAFDPLPAPEPCGRAGELKRLPRIDEDPALEDSALDDFDVFASLVDDFVDLPPFDDAPLPPLSFPSLRSLRRSGIVIDKKKFDSGLSMASLATTASGSDSSGDDSDTDNAN